MMAMFTWYVTSEGGPTMKHYKVYKAYICDRIGGICGDMIPINDPKPKWMNCKECEHEIYDE